MIHRVPRYDMGKAGGSPEPPVAPTGVNGTKKTPHSGGVFVFRFARLRQGISTKSMTWMMPLLARMSGATMLTELLFALITRLR